MLAIRRSCNIVFFTPGLLKDTRVVEEQCRYTPATLTWLVGGSEG